MYKEEKTRNVLAFNELFAAPNNANVMTLIGHAPPARGKDVVLGKGPNHGSRVGTDLGNHGCRIGTDQRSLALTASISRHLLHEHTRVSQRS